MSIRLQQSHVEGQMNLDDYRNIKSITALSNLLIALVAGTVGMIFSFGWLLLT